MKKIFISALLVSLALLNLQPINAASAAYAWDCGHMTSKPKSLTIYCADAGIGLAKLTWSNWGGTTASGVGVYYANNCDPNCAEGKVIQTKVKVTLYQQVMKSGKKVYAKVKFTTYKGNLPLMHTASGSWTLISKPMA